MLNENIKKLRKIKGFTQEELASKLNVTRQTISKWEKGYSVPDAEILENLAEIFETNVSQLLGGTINQSASGDMVAEQLSRINEQLVIKNRRTRRIWKTIGIIILIIFIIQLLLIVLGAVAFDSYKTKTYIYSTEQNIEEFE